MRVSMRQLGVRALRLAIPAVCLLLGGAAGAVTVTASPRDCTSVNDGGDGWSRPSRAVSSNDSQARADSDGTATDYLRCTNFGFAIPAGATINGITVYVERRSDRTANGGSRDAAVRLVRAGAIGAVDRSTSTTYTTSDVVEAHGGPADPWGATWTAADINAVDFGAAFKAIKSSASGEGHEIRVDHIYIAVDYTHSYTPGVYTVTASPSACSNVGGIGSLAWSDTGYALASDDRRARVSTWNSGTYATNFLVCTGYGFALPNDAIVNGITVDVERRLSSSGGISARDNAVRVVKGGAIGVVDGSSAAAYGANDSYGTHGGAGDLWGTPWTPADINSGSFGAAFSAILTRSGWSSHSRRIEVDHLRISVTFTVPSPALTPAAFNAYETGTSPAGAISGVLTTKVAGAPFAFDIGALNTTRTALVTTFNLTVKVELLDASGGGTPDGNNCNASWPLIQRLPDQTFTGNSAAPEADRTITGSGGRHRVGDVVVADAWKNVAVRVTYPASGTPKVVGCATDHFAVRPAGFADLRVTDGDWDDPGTTRSLDNRTIAGAVVHKAGRPVTIRATAVNAVAATTANYAEVPVGIAAACAISGTACTSAFGSFLVGAPAVAGILNSSAATYDEVGAFGLQLQDRSFADIDAADGSTADCTGRYICSAIVDVGRFVPDHFAYSAANLINRADLTPVGTSTTADAAAGDTSLLVAAIAGFRVGARVRIPDAGADGDALYATVSAAAASTLTLDTALLADLPAGAEVFVDPGFTYLGEPLVIGVTLTAQAADNSVTGNYQGSLARLDPLAGGNPLNLGLVENGSTRLAFPVCGASPGHPCFTPAVATGGSFAAGVAEAVAVPITVFRGASPTGPYAALDIGIAPVDADGVAMASYDLDTDATAGDDHTLVARANLRYGRLRLANAYGSELLPLPIGVTAQYWNGSTFVTHGDDSQTLFLPADVGFSNYRLNVSSGLVSVVTPPTTVGFSRGAARFTLSAPGANHNGSVDLTATAPAYLPANTARAVFGAYKSPAIYRRESY